MIYLNNAATSKAKPPEVLETVHSFLKENNVSPGRGADTLSLEADEILTQCRASLSKLFNAQPPDNIVFTLNCSDAINTALKGFLKPGGHVLISSIEHNSIVRPLRFLERFGVETETVPVRTPDYAITAKDLRERVKKNTRMIAVLHASNVIGALQPLKEIGLLAKEKGLAFLVDAAQTAGAYDIDVKEMNIDFLAFAGHKGLMGPMGTGGLYIGTKVNGIEPLRHGGTGTISESETQPDSLPDRFETGTPNTPGIAGLLASTKFILKVGTKNIRSHTKQLTGKLLEGLSNIKGLEVYGPNNPEKQAAVVSFNIKGMEPSAVGGVLEKKFGIIVRTGLHCSPLCHKTIETFPKGTVRISAGYYNTEKDIEAAIKAVKEIAIK